jgi:hypothetical protein
MWLPTKQAHVIVCHYIKLHHLSHDVVATIARPMQQA